jgi:hypothetical protein
MRCGLIIAVAGTALLTSCTGASSGPDTGDRHTRASLARAPDLHINVAARDATRDGGFIMQAGLLGVLRRNAEGCLYAYVPKSPGSGGREFRTDIVWPRGTTVALNHSRSPVVVRYDGVVVAMVGRSLRGLGGGSVTARRASDITCRVHEKGPLFYVQGDMPPLTDGD